MNDKIPNQAGAPQLRRNALSAIELLVTISVIGLLVALALPALQAARESSRRTHCGSNVRELGHAMLQFEQVNGRLPAGGKGIDFSTRPPSLVFEVQSAFSQILPYFEESYLASACNGQYAYNDAAWPGNQVAARAQVPVFLCPSNTARLPDPGGYGQTDYMPTVYTDIDPVTGTRNPLAMKAGAMTLGGSPIGKITDGLSRTIAMLEDSGRNWEAYSPNMRSGFADPAFSGGSALVWNGASQVPYTQWLQSRQLLSGGLSAGDCQTPSGDRAMNRWAEPACGGGISGQANSTLASLVRPINGNALPAGGPEDCPWSTTNCGPNEEAWSSHPWGAQALMCDGSARFIGNEIAPIVLRHMVTPEEQVPYDDTAVP